MELNGYRLLLPEGTLDYFDLVAVVALVSSLLLVFQLSETEEYP